MIIIRSVGEFLGKNLSEEEVRALCESTSIDNMRETSRNLGRDGGAEQGVNSIALLKFQ